MLHIFFFVLYKQIKENTEITKKAWPDITPRQTWPTDTPSWPPSFSKFYRETHTESNRNVPNFVRPISAFCIFIIFSIILVFTSYLSRQKSKAKTNNGIFSPGEDLHLMSDLSENSPPHPTA